MMEGWNKELLGDLLEINTESIGRNYPFKRINYYDISSVNSGFVEEIDTIPLISAPSRAKRIVKNKDTILSTVRPRNRSFYYFKEAKENDIASTGFAVLRPNLKKLDDRFLYHLVTNYNFTAFLASNEKGAAYPAVTPEVIGRAKIILPPLPTQRKIAKILSAYDELIENNLKRIKLLEEMAQKTYEEWFVRFKFPGYETAVFDKGTGLPEGWERLPFEEMIDFKEGPGLRNWQYREKGVPFLNIRVIKNGDLDMQKVQYLDTEEVNSKYKHFLLAENDHVISSSGTLGRLTTIRKRHLPLCLNTSIIRMRQKNDRFGTWLIKHMLQGQIFQSTMDAYANGSAQVNFGPTHLKQIKLPTPNLEISLAYEKIMAPLEECIKGIRDQNQYLKEARNILLPRLMTGMIDVEKMELKI